MHVRPEGSFKTGRIGRFVGAFAVCICNKNLAYMISKDMERAVKSINEYA